MRTGDRKKRDWYFIITMGMGLLVCASSLALLIYLLRLVMIHGMDLTLAMFLFVPILTFAAGMFFIRISGLETLEEDIEEEGLVLRKIGILSDTHGLLRPEVIGILRECDAILHAGDFDNPEVLEKLETIAPVYAVRGNNDTGPWAQSLEKTLRVEIEGLRFLMAHKRNDLPQNPEDADIVVFGHSHKYSCQEEDGVLWLNPGSCGRKRFHLPLTLAVVEMEENSFRIKQHILDDSGSN